MLLQMRLAHMISWGLMLDAEEVCARILLFSDNLTLELWGALEGASGCLFLYLLDHGLKPPGTQ